MNRLLDRQIAKATNERGEVDFDAFVALVDAGYEEAERDRRRTNRSIELMIKEIEQAQDNLLQAIDLVPEGFVLLDPNDRYIVWNKQYAEIYGVCSDKIVVGSPFADTLKAGVDRGLFVRATGREKEWLAARMEGHAMHRYTSEELLAGDRWVLVEERRTADGGSVGIRIDITDLKRSEASFRLMFDSNPLPMWIHNSETNLIAAVNSAMLHRYGYARHRLVGSPIADVVRESDPPLAFRPTQGYQGANQLHVTADGTLVRAEVSLSLIDYEGQPCRMSAVTGLRAVGRDTARHTRGRQDRHDRRRLAIG